MVQSVNCVRAALAALLLTTVSAGAAVPAAESTDWPRWRGPDFNDTSRASGIFDGSFGLKTRWKTTLGSGYSGVVVSSGRAVTMFSDGERDFLAAVDADTGAEQWRVAIAATYPGREGANDGPVSTPAIAGGQVFALGPLGDLLAVDLQSGRENWRRRLAEELKAVRPHWGFSSSPLVTDEHVIVLTGGSDGAVSAFDRKNGATAWRTGSDVANYQSPILLSRNGRTEIIVAGDRALHGLDPTTGRELWELEHEGERFYAKIVNPVVVPDRGLLLTNRPDEARLIGFDEPRETVWTTRHLKRNYASPIYHEGYIYGYSGSFLTCVDAASGELVWKSRSPGNGFPILVDGHLVIQVKNGPLHVVEATPDGYRERARIDLFSLLTWVPPSFAGGRIYSRDTYGQIAAVDIVPLDAAAGPGRGAIRGRLPNSAFGRWVAEVEGSADPAQRVRDYLGRQAAFPILEGERRVHIVYEGEVDDIALRGDLFEIGEELPLHRVAGTNLYYASFELEPDARIHYQFVRNLEEFIADPRNPASSASVNYRGEVSVLYMPRSDRGTLAANGPPAARGRLVEVPFATERVAVGGLTWGGEREIKVHLPPGYDDDPQRRYPVLYVLYGNQMLEMVRLDEVIDLAIAQREIEPLIAVFVQVTSGYEYARGQRNVHGAMLAEQLAPLIDQRFRTRTDAARRAVLGVAEGGFGAAEVGLRYPSVFGAVAAMSVLPVGEGDQELLARIEPRPETPPRFYVDWGRYDMRHAPRRIDIRQFARTLHDRLATAGYPVAGREWNDGADLAVWGLRSAAALRALFPATPSRGE